MFERRHTAGLRWIMAVATLLGCVIILSIRTVHLLLIDDVRKERPVFAARIKPGDLLSIGFLHSVETCRVWAHLQIDPDFGLVVVATDFKESRTGLPYAAFAKEVFERRKDGFRISNMHRPVPELYQWVDATYENALIINNDRAIDLASLAGNTLLYIRIGRLTLFEWFVLEAKLSPLFRSN